MNVDSKSNYKNLKIYKDIADGVVNTASLFLYFALSLLTAKNGIVSMIIPKSFFSVQSWKKIRNEILENMALIAINDVGKAFEKVGLEQGILVVSKRFKESNQVEVLNNFIFINKISQKYFKENEIILTSCNQKIFEILLKIENNKILLGQFAEMPRGITEKSNAYEFKKSKTNLQVLGGTNIKKYCITDGNIRKPNRYIESATESLKSKKDIFSKERICYQNLMSSLPKIVATIIQKETATDDTVNNLILNNSKYDYKFILSILNSKLTTFYLKYKLLNCATLTVHLDKPYVGKLPLPTATPAQQQEIITLVDKILAAKKEDSSADTSVLEKQIDTLVYKLYGLTDEEIAIVEGK